MKKRKTKKRKKRTDTKVYQNKQIKKIRNRCLKLWKECVKLRAHNKCEAPLCPVTKKLNAAHIEDYNTHRFLRYDLNNGLCLCPFHHKWGADSAHNSFLFMQKMCHLFVARFVSLKIVADFTKKTTVKQDLKYFKRIEQRLLRYKQKYQDQE